MHYDEWIVVPSRSAELLVPALDALDMVLLSSPAVTTNVATTVMTTDISAPDVGTNPESDTLLMPTPTPARPISALTDPSIPSPQEFLAVLDKSRGSSAAGAGGGNARRFSGVMKKAGATIYKIQGAANSEHSIAEEEKVAFR